MLAKLAFLATVCRLGLLPNIAEPLASRKGAGLIPLWCELNGVDSVPKEWRGLWVGAMTFVGTRGTTGNTLNCFLQGVSGMCAFGNPPCGSSLFLFFFDMRPVDMNAAGKGLADL
jgi:hypothetical protein